MGAVCTGLTLLVFQGDPAFSRAELASYDFQFQQRGNRSPPSTIVVVGLDDSSIGLVSGGRYPIPRAAMAQAIAFLHRAGAKVIAPDFAYVGPSGYGTSDDGALSRAVKAAGNVALVDLLPGNAASSFIQCETSLELPIDPLPRYAAGLGLANVPLDSDGAVRAADLMQVGGLSANASGACVPGKLLPSFPLMVASLALHQSPSAIARRLGNRILINYNGYQDPGNAAETSFQYVQFVSVERGEDAPSLFRDKIVLLIPAANITKDLFTTPYGPMYGGFVQANTINTILQRDSIVPAGPLANNIILILLGLATTVAATSFRVWRSAAATVALAGTFAIAATILFREFLIWVNLVTPEASLVIVFGAIMAVRFGTEERLRRKATKTFGRYVKPEIVELLMDAPDAEKALPGTRRSVSVLFVDIRGFTKMSEHMEPERVVSTLDIYLEELSRCVDALNGTVDKYVGDELMALWNAPHLDPEHALLAIRCALNMLSGTEKIQQDLVARGLPPIEYGIGVNTGPAVVGQMGSSLRNQYTAIGDTVNTAARLCGAAGSSEILIGQGTWEVLGDRLIVEETGALQLKGKSDPLRTFRVLGIRDEGEAAAVPQPLLR